MGNAKGDAYRLQFKTGSKLGAGTDAAVRLELTDAQGKKWKPYFAQVRVHLIYFNYRKALKKKHKAWVRATYKGSLLGTHALT